MEKCYEKTLITEKIYANKFGFENDMVFDTKNHGGLEKAIFANSTKNYKIWAKFLNKNINYGDMGENLTINGLDESSVCVEDIHKIGSLVIQVSQPRKPCFKISKMFKHKNFTAKIIETGLTGWYYRVLEESILKCGDEVKIIQKYSVNLSILELNKLFYNLNDNSNIFEKLKICKTLSNEWNGSI
ncbi:MOSC domain-containing protein [Campylobacter portucalensis]|uniref:MOSC domain-containing protein n=1 Tax=Campylobacter portucalensis TaxID=2608384 RepID=UPI001E44C198|nr:MOSC domain-containing protein [Campylobacter portucalensis]